MYLAKLLAFLLLLLQVAFILIALLSVRNGRAVMPKTAPWSTAEGTFIQEQTTIDDGALQNEHSSMPLATEEEPTQSLQTGRLDEKSEPTNKVHSPIPDAVERKRQETLSRLKRNACIKGMTKYNENGVTYSVVQCASNCYPVYGKTDQGTAIVVGCVNKLASG